MTAVIGCKLLRADGTSLNGKYRYNLDGEWNVVPGNGAYVAITDGLTSGVMGERLVYLECEEPIWVPTRTVASDGVQCFRRVRVIPPCPDRISPELRGEVAFYAPNLTSEQRFELACTSTPEWRGRIAFFTILSVAQRFELARQSDPEWRGLVAYNASELTPEQRFALALDSTPYWRGIFAYESAVLTPEQRFALAVESTPERQRIIALYAPNLTSEQREMLLNAAKGDEK
jgi:hypothetical protein